MKTFITSDLHFGHANIMKFCPKTRPFAGVQDMNASMMLAWNELIGQEDLVYVLGDLTFMPSVESANLISNLNGRKILVEGNHDQKNLREPKFRDCFEEIHKYHEITHNGHKVVMFHYPICEWNRMHHGSVHFYGHLHGNLSGLEKYRARDAGYDATGKIAVTLDEMVAQAMKGEVKGHH
jgi:calcineurin-like phosphoesterase family protein